MKEVCFPKFSQSNSSDIRAPVSPTLPTCCFGQSLGRAFEANSSKYFTICPLVLLDSNSSLGSTVCKCRRAKPGRFGSLAFAMKNRHFGGQCSWILGGKAQKCGIFWVFACVPNPGKQKASGDSVLQVLGNKARKHAYKSPYEEQSRKGPRHNLDLSRKKWETPGFGNPPV